MGNANEHPAASPVLQVGALSHRALRIYKILIVGIILGLCTLALWRVVAEILSEHGFNFLFDPTGWDIAFSILPFSNSDPYWWAFCVGLMNTVFAGVLGIIGATATGLFVGAIPLMSSRLLNDCARLYVNIIRNVPLILQLSLWYGIILHLPPARSALGVLGAIYISNRGLAVPKFADTATVSSAAVLLIIVALGVRLARRHAPNWRASWFTALRGMFGVTLVTGAIITLILLWPRILTGIPINVPTLKGLNFVGGFQIPPEFVALAAAIIVYRGAYISELFRAGFTSTPRGQIDAAKALGLRPWTIWRQIRFPLALIMIVPPLSSEYINITKVTAIGIIVGFSDLFMISSNATMQTGRPLEVMIVMMFLYLMLNYTISTVMNAINSHVRRGGFT